MRPCIASAFQTAVRLLKQRGRLVRRPRARRRFHVFFIVNTKVRVFMTAGRGGRVRARSPRHGTKTKNGGIEKLQMRGLRRGRYGLRLSANSDLHNQRRCIKRRLRVRGR